MALAHEQTQIRCDSEADGKVRMKEEKYCYFSIFACGIFATGFFLGVSEKFYEVVPMKKDYKNLIVMICIIAMLSAVSFVLFLFEFPILPSVGHLKLDLSDIPALVAGVFYGPIPAVIVELIKNIIELIAKGFGTQMGFGNMMNFIVGCAFVVPFSLIYKRFKGGLSILIASVVSTLCIVLVGLGTNYFITPLFFKYFLGVTVDSATLWTAITTATILNAVKGVMLSLVSIPIINVLLVRLKKFKI